MAIYYKKWPGNNLFPFGACIMGSDLRYFFLTIIMISIPAILFPSVVGFYFYLTTPLWSFIVVVCLSTFIGIMVYLLLFLTSATDPGIIIRQPPVHNLDTIDTRLTPPVYETVLLNGKEITLKYCYTCNVYRPPRSSHCSACDNCCEKWDHHCPWTGTCIGRRNYRYFYCFITLVTFSSIIGFLLCCLQIVLLVFYMMNAFHLGAGASVGYTFLLSIPMFIIMGVFAMGGSFTFLLFWFHTFLISINRTTYEHLKKYKYNTYNRGLFYNWWSVLCQRVPRSNVIVKLTQ